MTLVSARHLVRSVNERIAGGRSVAVLAFGRYTPALGNSRNVGKRIVGRLRDGDVLSHQLGEGVYTVACTGAARDRHDDADGALEAAVRRIGRELHDAAGAPFGGVWQRLARPTTTAELREALHLELATHLERRFALARLAHELRSPLSSIRGYLELLEGCDVHTDRRVYVQTARAETLRLTRMLDGMVEFSPLEGSAEGVNVSCNVAAAIERAVAAIRPRAIQRDVEVRIFARTRRAARIAPDDCIRATTNVLENAINAGARNLMVAATYRSGAIGVTVDDDGPGVRVSERTAIFACGRRGEAATRYPGSGFGLASVRSILGSCGGSVSVSRSRLGGARFLLRFRPAEPVEEKAALT